MPVELVRLQIVVLLLALILFFLQSHLLVVVKVLVLQVQGVLVLMVVMVDQAEVEHGTILELELLVEMAQQVKVIMVGQVVYKVMLIPLVVEEAQVKSVKLGQIQKVVTEVMVHHLL